MTEDSQSSPSSDLDKAKALLDAFETISDTGQTTRSGQSARKAVRCASRPGHRLAIHHLSARPAAGRSSSVARPPPRPAGTPDWLHRGKRRPKRPDRSDHRPVWNREYLGSRSRDCDGCRFVEPPCCRSSRDPVAPAWPSSASWPTTTTRIRRCPTSSPSTGAIPEAAAAAARTTRLPVAPCRREARQRCRWRPRFRPRRSTSLGP